MKLILKILVMEKWSATPITLCQHKVAWIGDIFNAINFDNFSNNLSNGLIRVRLENALTLQLL